MFANRGSAGQHTAGGNTQVFHYKGRNIEYVMIVQTVSDHAGHVPQQDVHREAALQ